MGLRFFTNRPLSQLFELPSTPLSARIAARVDLEGSQGLESLPGALFFFEVHVVFWKNALFAGKKTAGGIVLNLKQKLAAAARPAWPGLAGPGRAGPGPGLAALPYVSNTC